MTILLDALASMGVLSKNAGRYRCEPELAPYLSSDGDESILPMLRHRAAMWRRWSGLTDIVRGSAGQRADSRSTEGQQAFIGAMAVVTRKLAPAVAKIVDPSSATALLDIGGGPGTFTRAFLEAAPNLKATLFDLPDVVEIARERLAQSGVLGRVAFAAGDFYADELPRGHDLALLSAIIHQNSQKENEELYGKVLRALEPGGRLVIRDHVLQPDRTASRAAAVFAVNMLVATEGGNCYTFDEIRAGLARAGFEKIRLIQGAEDMLGMVEGFKPN